MPTSWSLRKQKTTPIFSAAFIDNVKGLMYNKTNIHHSHITGEILGHSHRYCNLKLRENRDKVSVIANNLFRFDFFFFLKGIKAGSWRARDICIGGKNPRDRNFVNIGSQVTFIDAIRYFQQSLGFLASTITDEERAALKRECKELIPDDEALSEKFNLCSEEDQEWVLKYLSTGKEVTPYEMITRFDSSDISPKEGSFFLPHQFYSRLKETKDYDSVKKFYQTMKLKNLDEINILTNFKTQ